MKKFWKIATPVLAFILVVCITITSMTLFSKKETVVAEPKVPFNGTTNIVAGNSEENPFEMWELVPSADMAELAFMYDEKEIEDWEEKLKSKSSEERKPSEERKAYMDELKAKWSGLYNNEDNPSAQALMWEDYEECYGLGENDVESSWKPLELFDDAKEILDVGTPGYWMKDVSMGNGDYLIRATYEPAAKYKDNLADYPVKYKQLADYYIFSEEAKQYYGIIFEKADIFENEDGTYSAGGQKLYVASKSWYIYNENDYDTIKAAAPNAYIYKVSRENIDGAYEFVDVISNLPYHKFDLDNYFYYSVGFSYVDDETKLSASRIYYTINSVSFLVDEEGNGVGEYAANPDAVYVKAESEKEGNFVCTESECYDYVGAGNGTHCLIEDSNEQIKTYPVKVGKIYYKGGFVCNRLMEKEVFHVSDNDAMDFTVETWDPRMLNDYWQNDKKPDLLYISSRSLVKEKNSGSETKTFSKDNDISWETARKILMLAKDPNVRLPIVVDKSIIDTSAVSNYGDANSYTNLQRLVALLCSDQIFQTKSVEKEKKTVTEVQDVLSIDKDTDWKNIAWYQLTYNRQPSNDNDYDYGYVNNNIYVYPGNSLEPNSSTPFIFKSFATENIADGKDGTQFLEKAKEKGFGEIAEYINAENLSRKLENDRNGKVVYQLFDLSITKATVVEYIINYCSRDKKEWDSSVHILEIQPGGTDGNNPTLSADTIKTKLKEKNYEVDEVKITFMTTSEFVGKIEELSKYDMIYFGLDTYAFHKDDNDSTVYNDTDMNGLIYSNIGDIIAFQESYLEGTPGFTGLLESDYYHRDGKRYAIKLIDGNGKTVTKNEKGEVTGVKEYETSNGEREADNFISPNKNDNSTYRIADNTYRFSGNDISKGKLEDVCDYVDAGHPVLVDNGFFSNNGDIDDSKIDDCSYMYELMCKIKGKENVFAFDKDEIGKTDLDKVMQYITNGKPEITILKHDRAYYCPDPDSDDSRKSQYDFFDVKNNTITLEFQLTNHGAASDKSTFICALYLDANADGKFSKTQEKISATEIRMTKDGNILKPKDRSGADNKTEYYYEIEPGTSYRYQMSYELPTGTIGLIPWKLEVSQSDNPLRSVSEDGFFYNKKPGTDKTEINILQINTASKSKTVDNFNMEAQLKNKESKFYKYVSNVPDFSLKIKTIPADQFGGHDKSRPENIYTKYEFFDKCVDGKPADMLVIGFADMFLIDNENGCLDGIVQFINEGNPVLFTHDTTSFYNNTVYDYPLYTRFYRSEWCEYPKGNWWEKRIWEGENGYEFNTKIRNLVGMDRYGVLTNTVLKEGTPLSEDSDKFGEAIAQSVSSNVDIGYVPKSGKKKLAKQIQGFAYGFMTYNAAKDPNYNNSKYLTYLPYRMDRGKGNGEWWWNQQIATKVEQINSGQITNYPYKIPKSFEPSPTHYQFYQLDLNEDEDEDGESDIVVWYTLGADADKTVYFGTPRDVRNNYYIYTKGNVTYSGVGHSAVTKDEEIKLYINTMIAAYHSGINPAQLSLRTGEAEDADPMKVMYIAFDQTIQEKGDGSKELVESTESIEQSEVDQAKDTNDQEKLNKSEKGNTVYFTVTDKNIIRNLHEKKVEMTFGVYLTDKKDEYDKLSKQEKDKCVPWEEGGKTIYLKEFKPTITNMNGEEDMVKTTGATYKAVIPPDILGKDQNHATVYVIAKVKITQQFTKYENNEQTTVTKVMEKSPTAVETFRVQRIGLMDLD